MHKNYYSLLDAVRFLAAFWVVNFHYFAGRALSTNLSWYRYGNLGVQLFFIVSGFVIVQSLQGKTLKEFAINRFIRLFPLFWIVCTLTYVITLIIPHSNHVSVGGYLTNMTMLPDVINGYFGHGSLIDASYWTLTIELLFYTGIGVFCYFFSYKNIRYFLAAWFAFSVIAFVSHIDKYFFIKLFLVHYASYFIFGSALALIVIQQAKNLYEKYFDWTLLGLGALYSLYIHTQAISAYGNPNPHDTLIVGIILTAFFICIPVLVYLSKYVKNSAVIHALAIIGGLTYPLYLLHQRIGNVVMAYITSLYGISWTVLAICFEVLIVVVAYVLYLQDKKIRVWLKKKLLH